MKNAILTYTALALIGLQPGCKDSFRYSEEEEIKAINRVLSDQTTAWNQGNQVGYMQGYLNSDKLIFYTSRGSIYGWDNVMDMYTKSFPNRDDMGKLAFEIDTIYSITSDIKNVAGQWVVHKSDTMSGQFVLTLKKFDNKGWKIIEDHTW